MKPVKYGVILLVLLLAAMAMVPMVSAEEQTSGTLDVAIPVTSANSTVHQIPADYLKDSKPAQWIPESDMINIVISQKSLEKFSPDKQSGIINIPVSYLDMKTTFLNSKENPNIYAENTIGQGDSIALVRMPRQMYEMFAKNSNTGLISLPEDYFVRYYENVSDLKNHLKVNGTSLQVLPSEKYPAASVSAESGSRATIGHLPVPNATGTIMSPATTYPQMFEYREHYNRQASTNYDYCIGEITPYSWTLLGSALDQFDIYQEREYRFNSNEAIEIVAQYRDRNQGGDIVLYPTLYRNGASTPISPSQWTVWSDYLAVDKNNIPHTYGYHVYFSGGYYYIGFEDMSTLQWVKSYQATAATGTTSFTELWGSSEYRQRAAPTTNTFSATTNPVIDEWARILNGNWQKPNLVWQHLSPGSSVSYVSVQTLFDSSGNLITRSYGQYP